MKRITYIIMAFFLAFVFLAAAYFTDWLKQNNTGFVGDFLKILGGASQNARLLPKPTHPASAGRQGDHVQTSEYPALAIRDEFFAKEFAKINAVLDDYKNSYRQNVSNEDDLLDAYYVAFSTNNPEDEELFDAWVNSYSNNYQPYLARASYFVSLGLKARGDKWIRETSDEQIKEMGRFFSKAVKDINRSLDIAQDNMLAYYLLINIHRADGDKAAMTDIVNKALEKIPDSFRLRSAYLLAITPRWAGSYEEMEKFADESQKFLEKNPRIKFLKGYVSYDTGDMQIIAKNFGEALKLLNNALSLGDLDLFYGKRANIYDDFEKYDEALADINAAIKLRPQAARYYYSRAHIMAGKNSLQEALDDIELADRLEPNDQATAKLKNHISDKLVYSGYSQYKAKNFDRSLKDYTAALRANPRNADAYSRRTRVYINQKDLQSAFSDLATAIELEPNNFDFYLLMDWLLTQHSDWDGIIRYWTQYIATNSNSDRAYLERGGAYFRKGDISLALADAKTAADLGNEEGRKVYEKYKGRIMK
jgi:tetratricopeptide (TPR) repeat protein